MESLVNCIDCKRFRRDVAMDEGGRFTDEGHICNTRGGWDWVFDRSRQDIPDEYRITGSGSELERDSNITVLVVEPGKEP